MAEVVVTAQVLEQLIIVQVALVTELTERMSPMGCIIRVTLHTVASQVLAGVPLALIGEDLQRTRGWTRSWGSQPPDFAVER